VCPPDLFEPKALELESPADRGALVGRSRCYSVALPHLSATHVDSEFKKGSAEFLILSLVEDRALHGYDIARLIDERSKGALTFYAASLYPLLYRLERRGWITGRWLEQAGVRRRRMYRITAAGRRVLAARRTTWEAFVRAVNLVTRTDHA
jgi:PadR family transcriptional regulator PadR